jgi:hypothetical protein
MNNTMSASGLQVLGQTLEPRQQVMDPSAITGTFNQVYRDGAPYDQIEITFTSDTTSTFSTAYFSLTADDTPWGTAAFHCICGSVRSRRWLSKVCHASNLRCGVSRYGGL